MAHLIEPEALTVQQIALIETLSTRVVFQAISEFLPEAKEIFRHSPDDAKDVAEDVTREAMARFPGFPVYRRIYGTMDLKRSGYVVLSEFITRQALLVDSKAEKSKNVARVQTSQTSLRVRQVRAGLDVDVPGELATNLMLQGQSYLTTTLFVHYHYRDVANPIGRDLRVVTIAALPNGRLQEQYAPSSRDTIWVAGANSPARNERFRARLSFSRLKQKSNWRVQHLDPNRALNDWED